MVSCPASTACGTVENRQSCLFPSSYSLFGLLWAAKTLPHCRSASHTMPLDPGGKSTIELDRLSHFEAVDLRFGIGAVAEIFLEEESWVSQRKQVFYRCCLSLSAC